ncbi:hypothetical protein DPMN_148914 [Dreissena polymorpha]|uniref:PNPLA domain-containing protein n=1 Tax=Dreissena polymorpha TaxID=45954 RepID=A0A9D4J4A0_DREPO|nr:hypothetical protein DPMN_148914 [Dreissena polymorpha]
MASVSYKIIALIALGAMVLGKDIRSGKNGPMSGGLFPIDSDDDKFEEIAQFAAKDIGSEYTLDSVEDDKAQTARSTSAAPSYFHPYNQFLDGGLMSNNPTLDILAEIHEFKKEQTKKADSGRSLDVVVSLGCGHEDYIPATVPDITFGSIYGIIPLMNFAKDVLYQVSISDGQPTNRASAWCEMMNVPFFRLSPLLTEDVPLNCVDKQKLERMIQKTKDYIGEQMDSITKIAQYLKR